MYRNELAIGATSSAGTRLIPPAAGTRICLVPKVNRARRQVKPAKVNFRGVVSSSAPRPFFAFPLAPAQAHTESPARHTGAPPDAQLCDAIPACSPFRKPDHDTDRCLSPLDSNRIIPPHSCCTRPPLPRLATFCVPSRARIRTGAPEFPPLWTRKRPRFPLNNPAPGGTSGPPFFVLLPRRFAHSVNHQKSLSNPFKALTSETHTRRPRCSDWP